MRGVNSGASARTTRMAPEQLYLLSHVEPSWQIFQGHVFASTFRAVLRSATLRLYQ